METWYLMDQLEKFRSGVRGKLASNRSEYLMGVGAKKIQDDYELAYVANWFSEQDPLPAIRTIEGNLEDGKIFYDQRCASCHGENGEGNRFVEAPSLQRLEGWYFLEQMRKFRSGQRGYHIKDITGQSMAAASKEISDRNLRNVVAYSVDAFGPEEEISTRDRLAPQGSRKPF
jgi:cytochrome c oxidase subunit 2